MAEPQMPNDLKGIVQRMIDAGESEDNIGAVITHYNQVVAPAQAAKALGAPQVHHGPDGKPYISDDPNDVQQPSMGRTVLEGMQQMAADPLMVLTADMKMPALATKALGSMVAGARRLPVRSMASGAAHVAGDLLESPIANVLVSPKLGYMGKAAHAIGDWIKPEVAAVKASKNAGGILLKNPPARIPAEDAMAGALNDVRTASAPVEPSLESPPPKTITAAGQPATTEAEFNSVDPELSAQGRTVGGLPTPSPTQSLPPSPNALSPIAQEAMQTTGTPAPPSTEPLSPIAQQLMDSLNERASSPSKVSIDKVPKSRSSGTQGNGSAGSATPGLTRNDMESAGLNPDIKITSLTQDMIDNILANRASRGSRYREDAALLKRLDTLLAKE